MLLAYSLSTTALQSQPQAAASLRRRHVAVAIFALPTLSTRPQRADALFGDAAFGNFGDGGSEVSQRWMDVEL